MFENPKVDRLLMWLNAPGYCVLWSDVYPADEIALYGDSVDVLICRTDQAHLAMNLQLLHASHACSTLSKVSCRAPFEDF